ncbi:hypothetical protein MMC11_009126 [Xylographa trunciseda]|nr:hypothetical protein [Xylographa trunciseda]
MALRMAIAFVHRLFSSKRQERNAEEWNNVKAVRKSTAETLTEQNSGTTADLELRDGFRTRPVVEAEQIPGNGEALQGTELDPHHPRSVATQCASSNFENVSRVQDPKILVEPQAVAGTLATELIQGNQPVSSQVPTSIKTYDSCGKSDKEGSPLDAHQSVGKLVPEEDNLSLNEIPTPYTPLTDDSKHTKARNITPTSSDGSVTLVEEDHTKGFAYQKQIESLSPTNDLWSDSPALPILHSIDISPSIRPRKLFPSLETLLAPQQVDFSQSDRHPDTLFAYHDDDDLYNKEEQEQDTQEVEHFPRLIGSISSPYKDDGPVVDVPSIILSSYHDKNVSHAGESEDLSNAVEPPESVQVLPTIFNFRDNEIELLSTAPRISQYKSVSPVEERETPFSADGSEKWAQAPLEKSEGNTIEDDLNLKAPAASYVEQLDGPEWVQKTDSSLQLPPSFVEHNSNFAEVQFENTFSDSKGDTTSKTLRQSGTKFSEQFGTLKSIPRPIHPVRLSDDEPRKFSLEAQKSIMRWRSRQLQYLPYWIVNPDLQLILDTIKPALTVLRLDAAESTITWLAEGALHKVYTVSTKCLETGQEKRFVLRIALPVYPYYKVESDVATTEFIRHFTSIPVPVIYCYDSSANNALGLEWMLMEKIEADPLRKIWFDLDNDLRVAITRQLAGWADELSRIQSNQIGSIYMRFTDTQLQFFIGPPILFNLFSRRRLLYSVNRGPFNNLSDYYSSVLDSHIHELQDEATHQIELDAVLEKEANDVYENTRGRKVLTQEEADKLDLLELESGFSKEMIDAILPDCKALREALPQMQLPTLTTMLMHDDVSLNNVLTDDKGTVMALLDWEALVLLPRHNINAFITLLDGEDRNSSYDYTSYNPRRKYLLGGGEDDYIDPKSTIWEVHMEEIEEIVQTHLRQYYKAELADLRSPLCAIFAFDRESDLEQLEDRVLYPADHKGSVLDWLDTQLGKYDKQSEPEDIEKGDEEELNASACEAIPGSNSSTEVDRK